jgi:hypothetical protein
MTDATHEAEIKRSLVLDNGQTIFWRFKVEEGTLPDRWKTAQYTTFDEARKAVVDYCHEKGDRQLVKIDSGRQTAYEAGLGKHDEYNPPVLQTKDNVKKRHVEVAI